MRRTENNKRALIDTVLDRVQENHTDPVMTQLGNFAREYYRKVPEEDLLTTDTDTLYGAVLAHWRFGAVRPPNALNLRVYQPTVEQHGWSSRHIIVEMVNDDMPFLIDTSLMILHEHGFTVRLTVHPVVFVQRDAEGKLLAVSAESREQPGWLAESFVRFEVEQELRDTDLAALEQALRAALMDVRLAVADWPAMREQAIALTADSILHTLPVEEDIALEVRDFVRWLADDHFTFLGYCEYEVERDESGVTLLPITSSRLGINRSAGESSTPTKLTGSVIDQVAATGPLVLSKANARSTVHRSGFLDYVGLKRYDDQGNVVGEYRFLGLYTSSVYARSVRDIPLLRSKVARVMAHADLRSTSHAGKALLHIMDTLPRDELFQASVDELYEICDGILSLQGRERTKLFIRRDPYGRFFSCLVYIPLDRYHWEARERVEAILRRMLNGGSTESTVRVGESVMAQLHVNVRECPSGTEPADLASIESEIVRAVRSWNDDLRDVLTRRFDYRRGYEYFNRFRNAFPANYVHDFSAEVAADDVERMAALTASSPFAIQLYEQVGGDGSRVRLKLYQLGRPIYLSDALPMLENMGLRVLSERPYEINETDNADGSVWIHDFELTHAIGSALVVADVRDAFHEAFAKVWFGEAENDGFNRLALVCRLTWRQTTVLRAVYRYLFQTGLAFSQNYVEQALVENSRVASLLVAMFESRFAPDLGARREREVISTAQALDDALDQVASLDHDRILRAFLEVFRATLRTNYFQRQANGAEKALMSFKFDPERIPNLPKPLPNYEVFVYSPRVEGVHLRGGKVARGGIRWSDRREDFRTEVLGLLKAQMVKNSVIVPMGAKGGFVVKQPPAGGGREALQQEGVNCYRAFIQGLLDVTDNFVGGEIQTPEGVVRYDDDDPYLVVAADKGTATFSDIANEISRGYGFWLGDAFASGGSAGYDHKKMGITARGAWECVKRHFRELGHDIQTEDFTVVGVGDMGGDVFGNGMLLSRHIRLIAAFNHRHIFVDPNPNAEDSFRERKRLFDLPHSTWEDYDPALISPGGGVFDRQAKRIKLSEEMRRALGVATESLTPTELIKVIVQAPVDLFWNGGIGTYVKATEESHVDVGDRANDAVRVNGSDLRARVVGEGGNLGLTQLGRVEYALNGGKINTDYIDNSAGVDCSDHEVNIKILLNPAVVSGAMGEAERNDLLAQMTGEVAALVLRDNYLQSQALSLMACSAGAQLDEHMYVVRRLRDTAGLDARLEFLPGKQALASRRAQGLGLVRPELAVLLCYIKIAMYDALIESDLPEDAYLADELVTYFPNPLRTRFRQSMHDHRLRREIIATSVTNSLVNRMGVSFAQRMLDDMATDLANVARAYLCGREVFQMSQLWDRIESLDSQVPAEVQLDMMGTTASLLEDVTRWFLGRPARIVDISQTVDTYAPGVCEYVRIAHELPGGAEADVMAARAEALEQTGVPEDLAREIAAVEIKRLALDVVETAAQTDLDVAQSGQVYFRLGDQLELTWLVNQVNQFGVTDPWLTRALSGLRYDFFNEYMNLALKVIQSSDETEGEQRVVSWLQERPDAVSRFRSVLLEIQNLGTLDLAGLSVVVRELRRLAAC
ncbi:MAG: NAD-glutamate dehydrogenase [Pseudomonadota bacterium]|nr:NAD-glutamate dehydrogenase [Pseudomonadota bacterium]